MARELALEVKLPSQVQVELRLSLTGHGGYTDALQLEVQWHFDLKY